MNKLAWMSYAIHYWCEKVRSGEISESDPIYKMVEDSYEKLEEIISPIKNEDNRHEMVREFATTEVICDSASDFTVLCTLYNGVKVIEHGFVLFNFGGIGSNSYLKHNDVLVREVKEFAHRRDIDTDFLRMFACAVGNHIEDKMSKFGKIFLDQRGRLCFKPDDGGSEDILCIEFSDD